MAENFSMPSSQGGLMRYNEEYGSSLTITPEMAIVFVVLIVVFVSALKLLMPITV
ncbi:MAG: preprotein translocase subunit Sec61beta [Nanoarchaeota archaeon]